MSTTRSCRQVVHCDSFRQVKACDATPDLGVLPHSRHLKVGAKLGSVGGKDDDDDDDEEEASRAS